MSKLLPEERVARLEALLGIGVPDRAVLLQALTHKSYGNEHRAEGMLDNERLEFLGDAVVDLAVSHRLMERYAQASEGELSKLRALLVNEDSLASVARSLGLGELVLLGRGEDRTGGREKSSVLADTLEAVIGALYQSAGMSAVLAFVDRYLGPAMDGVAEGRSGQDHKTRLQELSQQTLRVQPRYRVVGQSGPEHEKIFEVEVLLGEALYATATGRSKKEAEQAAASKALERLLQEPAPG